MNKVYISESNVHYDLLMESFGFELAKSPSETGVVMALFTGSADVDPHYYHSKHHPLTGASNNPRDRKEEVLFQYCRVNRIAMLGICRGSQFLCVMNGGELYQDVDGHAINYRHMAKCLVGGEVFPVTSTHHQMMKPRVGVDGGDVLMVACESSYRDLSDKMREPHGNKEDDKWEDIESVFWGDTNSLGVQFHPEWDEVGSDCRNWLYKNIMDRLVFKS